MLFYDLSLQYGNDCNQNDQPTHPLFFEKKMTKVEDVSETSIMEAVKLLDKGQLVAIPTETVYGLAADSSNSEAVKEVYRVKGRP